MFDIFAEWPKNEKRVVFLGYYTEIPIKQGLIDPISPCIKAVFASCYSPVVN